MFLPAIAHLADGPGWRWAAGLVALFALLLVPLVLLLLADSPAAVGTTAYGAEPGASALAAPVVTRGAARVAIDTLR